MIIRVGTTTRAGLACNLRRKLTFGAALLICPRSEPTTMTDFGSCWGKGRAREASSETVAALDLGADDYVTKPFDSEELMAR